jgi:lipopolysaccharide export system permease protein
MKKPDRSEIIVAKEARQQPPTAGERPQIHLYDGYIYQLMRSPEEKDTIVKFEKLIYFTDNKAVAEINRKATTTSALSQSDRPKDIAEFQWRLSRPVATILLALIAVPLSRVSPRQDKSTRTYLIAAGVSSIYYVLSVLAQKWVLRGDVGRVPGLWWLHGLMLVIVLFLLFPRAQRLRRVSSSG